MHGLHLGAAQNARRIHHDIDTVDAWQPVTDGNISGEIAGDRRYAGKGAGEICHAPHRAHRLVAASQQLRHDMPADEAARPQNEDTQMKPL
jgi:hypothetical protein